MAVNTILELLNQSYAYNIHHKNTRGKGEGGKVKSQKRKGKKRKEKNRKEKKRKEKKGKNRKEKEKKTSPEAYAGTSSRQADPIDKDSYVQKLKNFLRSKTHRKV